MRVYLHALLASLDSGNVAGDTTADNDEVLLRLGGVGPPPSRHNSRQSGLGKSGAHGCARY